MNKITKIILGVVVLVVVVVSAVVFYKPTEKGTIKVGATLPITGIYAINGEHGRRGLELAVADINNIGGVEGKKIELIIYDNKGDATTAATDAQKLINVDGVDMIYSILTHTTEAIVSIAAQSKTFIMYQSTVSALAEKNPHLCMDYFSMNYMGVKYAQIAFKENASNVGLLYPLSTFGFEYRDSFKKEADRLGLNYTEESYDLSTKDLSTSLLKFKSKKVDAIALSGFATNNIVLFDAISNLNYAKDLKFVIGPHLPEDTVRKSIRTMAAIKEIRTITSYYIPLDITNKKMEKFIIAWDKLYSEEPVMEGLYAYDDIHFISEIIGKCLSNGKITGECMRQNMANKTFNGIEGDINFSDDCISDRKLDFQVYSGDGWIDYIEP